MACAALPPLRPREIMIAANIQTSVEARLKRRTNYSAPGFLPKPERTAKIVILLCDNETKRLFQDRRKFSLRFNSYFTATNLIGRDKANGLDSLTRDCRWNRSGWLSMSAQFQRSRNHSRRCHQVRFKNSNPFHRLVIWRRISCCVRTSKLVDKARSAAFSSRKNNDARDRGKRCTTSFPNETIDQKFRPLQGLIRL